MDIMIKFQTAGERQNGKGERLSSVITLILQKRDIPLNHLISMKMSSFDIPHPEAAADEVGSR